MRILENHQHWLLPRQALHLTDQRFECPLLLLLGAELRDWVARQRPRQREQLREKGEVFFRRRDAGSQRFEFCQSGHWLVVAGKSRRPAKLSDKRKQSAVLMVR